MSKHIPSKDQLQAIEKIVEDLNNSEKYQVLLGATEKNFTIANVI